MNPTPKVEILHDHRLVICRLEGCLDSQIAEWLLIYGVALEESKAATYNRLLDFSPLDQIRLSSLELRDIAQARRYALVDKPPFRAALLAPGPLAYGVARMYEMLMEGSPIEMRVFREPAAAADWLGVPPSVIATVPAA